MSRTILAIVAFAAVAGEFSGTMSTPPFFFSLCLSSSRVFISASLAGFFFLSLSFEGRAA